MLWVLIRAILMSIHSISLYEELMIIIFHFNALANVMRCLIGQHIDFATVYSAIYHQKTDVMSNIACDEST